MKIIAQLLLRSVLLALLALGCASLTAKAQTLVQTEEAKNPKAEVSKVRLIVESPVTVAQHDQTGAPEKYLLQVNDRLQRGRPDNEVLENESVLPKLSDAVPKEKRNKFAEFTEPKSGE